MKKTLTILLIIVLISIYKLFPGYSKIKELEEENLRYQERIDSMGKEIESLNTDLDKFNNDPFYLEKIARNELGIAKENEVIVHVD